MELGGVEGWPALCRAQAQCMVHPGDRGSQLPGGGPLLDLSLVRIEQEAHARAWEALKRKEREAASSSDGTLKPAASLTRVDSDTLKVSAQAR